MSASRILIDLTHPEGEESQASPLMSSPGGPPKGSKAPSSSDQEKRLRRYRSKPTKGIQDRIDRAQGQTMFLISKEDVDEPDGGDGKCTFVVLGSTGNVYDVTIQRVPFCTCPDHAKGNLCKHILFVLLKVMRVPSTSPLIYQAAWLGSELRDMFTGMRLRFQQVSGVMANAAVQESYKKIKGIIDTEATVTNDVVEKVTKVRTRDEVDDCPICFDSLSSAATTCCPAHCGTTFHQNCIQHWKRQQQRQSPTCPICRGSWATDVGTTSSGRAEGLQNEGYTNLGRLQGQSPDRDTSSYNPRWDDGPSYNAKRRRWR